MIPERRTEFLLIRWYVKWCRCCKSRAPMQFRSYKHASRMYLEHRRIHVSILSKFKISHYIDQNNLPQDDLKRLSFLKVGQTSYIKRQFRFRAARGAPVICEHIVQWASKMLLPKPTRSLMHIQYLLLYHIEINLIFVMVSITVIVLTAVIYKTHFSTV